MAIKDYMATQFKTGILGLLSKHFAPSILKNFELILELEHYNKDAQRATNLIRQDKDKMFVLEVYYRHPSGLLSYITDVCSWWTHKQCEYQLLKYITDKARVGEVGKEWGQDDSGRISIDVLSGKFETPEGLVTKDMPKSIKIKKEVKK